MRLHGSHPGVRCGGCFRGLTGAGSSPSVLEAGLCPQIGVEEERSASPWPPPRPVASRLQTLPLRTFASSSTGWANIAPPQARRVRGQSHDPALFSGGHHELSPWTVPGHLLHSGPESSTGSPSQAPRPGGWGTNF